VKLSLLEVVGLISGLFAFWALYKKHLEAANISAHVGDSVGLPLHSDGRTQSVHLDCTLANSGAKTGVVQKLVLLCIGPSGQKVRFDWELFYTYKGLSAAPAERPHSIAVHHHNSVFFNIQFNCEGDYDWAQGKHQFELLGWADRECSKCANIRKTFSIQIDEGQAALMENLQPPPRNASIIPFQIEESRVNL
jgi:hypothetical protein